MIDDGFTYAQIIERLGDVGKTLNKDNLSRWRLHQHQDWLEEQRFNELVSRHKQLAANEPAKDLLRIQREFGSEILRGILTRDPGKYYNVLNALARFAATQPSSLPEENPSRHAADQQNTPGGQTSPVAAAPRQDIPSAEPRP